jgi:tetratricopeptide (TPR) repeat protein
MDPKDMDRLM